MSHNAHLGRLCKNFNQRLEYFVDFEFTYFAGFCPFWCGSKMKHFHPNGPSVKCAKAFTNLTLRSLFFLIRILLFSYHKSITFTDPLWYIQCESDNSNFYFHTRQLSMLQQFHFHVKIVHEVAIFLELLTSSICANFAAKKQVLKNTLLLHSKSDFF